MKRSDDPVRTLRPGDPQDIYRESQASVEDRLGRMEAISLAGCGGSAPGGAHQPSSESSAFERFKGFAVSRSKAGTIVIATRAVARAPRMAT